MYAANVIPQAGQVWLQRFALEEPLDGGRQALTWRVRELETGAPRVLKILPLAPNVGNRARRRLAREADILSVLDHPSLPKALGFHETPGRAVVVLDWVPGRSLREVLRREGGPLTLFETARAVEQLASALGTCHDAGVIHRDLKPANIIVADETLTRFVLTDFGIARLLDVETSGATTVGRVLGTPRYAAPEQLGGEPVTAAADLFALAVVAYEVATGRRPWLRDTNGEALPFACGREPAGNDRESVSRRVVRGELVPPSRYRPDLGPLDDWFARALSARPDDRFPDAAAFAAAFRAALPPAALEPPPAPTRIVPDPVAPTWMVPALAATAVGLGIAIGATLWAQAPREAEPGPPLERSEPRPEVRAVPVPVPIRGANR